MTVSVGDRIPASKLVHMTDNGPEDINIADRIAGKRVVLFGLPGAYTRTCSAAHLPSFLRTANAFREKGIDEIICFAVNDVFVMNHWGESSGANEAGIVMLADWDAELTKALGLDFTAPPVGLKDRTTRCAMLVEDGVVKVLQIEEDSGTCNVTAGETLLELT
ncbi:MAG: peroxiredoxin [Pseudomonadota bacterium]